MTEQLLKEFEDKIVSFKLIPSDGGRFELTVNGDLAFSKLQLGRHAEYAEIQQAIKDKLKMG